MLSELSEFLEVDIEKQLLIDNLLSQEHIVRLCSPRLDDLCADLKMEYRELPFSKFCPKCHRKYPDSENACYECLVTLKDIKEKTPVKDIDNRPKFTFKGKNDFKDFKSILTEDNLVKVNEFRFTMKNYENIIKNIKKTSLKNMDEMIKSNYIDMRELSILEKILLFAKSFVKIDYKSYGQELGFFEKDKIIIDDRQNDSLKITTLIHELAHFILKEIINGVLCKLLKCSKNNYINIISEYILSYDNFPMLIDEYSAHCCEGRFTVYGYQDYSSFLSIIERMNGEMSRDEIEITKSIGNNFANTIKDILEMFIDDDLRDEIKSEFEWHNHDKPNYEMLKLENCNKLTDEGYLKAIWLVVTDGFKTAMDNIDELEKYYNGA
ncbi:hypothetical protein [uncultured Methanobrevibacter sp.]|uniref:hypothetical protein n=1 Tax=uncultured Methanobrevibacter sp. TaxID=253161 RepID=UPI0025EB898B|nr:hypothetical protein [uncultured Methanobrevibacter sp.]